MDWPKDECIQYQINDLHTQLPVREWLKEGILLKYDGIGIMLNGSDVELGIIPGVWCGYYPEVHEDRPGVQHGCPTRLGREENVVVD